MTEYIVTRYSNNIVDSLLSHKTQGRIRSVSDTL